MPSTTGSPDAARAAPMTAKTAGQASPTRASGTTSVVVPDVTPAWSATTSSLQGTTSSAAPSVTVGSEPPAAAVSRSSMADAAVAVGTTGAAPVATASVTSKVRVRTRPARSSGTVSSAALPAPVSTAPVSGCSARSGATMTHPLDVEVGDPSRWTGLRTVRPAQTASGAASTSETAPSAPSARRRPTTSRGAAPAASTASTVASSKRRSRSPTGSSTRVMPATETVPGMTQTWSAPKRGSCACHSESERHQRRTSASTTGTNGTGLPGRRHTCTKNGTSAGCSTTSSAAG